ncbi:MAG TPA: mannosyltransferase family protein [Anaerolineae bacterium]|nr:mannosyltransferase family protein [Anaerolineae bacterium]
MRPATQAIRVRLRQVADDRAVRWSLGIFVMLRVSLSVLAIVVVSLRPLPEQGHERYVMSLGLEPVSSRAEQLLLEVWQRWDVVHYQRIAAQGYTDDESSVFPPLLPALMRLLGQLLGGNYLLAGMVISNLAFALVLLVLYELARLDYGELVARKATLYLAIFPTAFFLLLPYSESLFLLLVLLAFYAGRHRHWVAASLAAAMASMTKLQGVVLILPLAYEYFEHIRFDFRRVGWQAMLLPLASLPPIAFMWFRSVTGYPSLPSVLRDYWHSFVGAPWHNFANLAGRLSSQTLSANDALDALITIPFLLFTLAAFRRMRRSYALYTAATMLVVLSVVYPPLPLMNLPRHILLLFPTFIFMATLGSRPNVHRCIVYASTSLLILLTGMFVQWLWIA